MQVDIKIMMEYLIKEVREKILFKFSSDQSCSFDGFCEGRCDVCPEKLIEFLDIEITHWEFCLKHDVLPKAIDLENLTKDYKKIYTILEKGGFLKTSSS